VIHVGAAAQPEVVPVLMKQLKPNGVLIIPVDDSGPLYQNLYTFESGEGGRIEQKWVCGVRFVPLTSAPVLRN
jgi:protein-L-isoaspartate O-methyltransferase